MDVDVMERKNTDLVKEFNTYICEHPEFADGIPNNVIVIMQLEGDEEFNKWSLKLAKSHAENGRLVIGVRIKKDETCLFTYRIRSSPANSLLKKCLRYFGGDNV